jgi:hypothetical protein
MAQQTGVLPIDHDRPAANRIARRPGQRSRDRIANDLIGPQLRFGLLLSVRDS